jgi:hypothetical protein
MSTICSTAGSNGKCALMFKGVTTLNNVSFPNCPYTFHPNANKLSWFVRAKVWKNPASISIIDSPTAKPKLVVISSGIYEFV